MKLLTQYLNLKNEATTIINERISKIKEFTFLTDGEIDNRGETFYKAPCFYAVDKYSNYTDYAITHITKDEQGVKFHGLEKGEGDSERTVRVDEVELDWICYIGDILSENKILDDNDSTNLLNPDLQDSGYFYDDWECRELE